MATKLAEVVSEGVQAHGGEVVELRGDEALSVFDSARQALRAAVELRSAFADETASEPELPLNVGMGLDAGEAVPVGDGYRGAALNLAARLCSIAGPGEVLATEGLMHMAGRVDGITVTRTEPTTFKGYDEPVAPLRVGTADESPPQVARTRDAAHAEPSSLPPELDPIVPLAGREAEMSWLRWHWRRAVHGHGRALVISGPPGIGKTRVSAELAVHASAMGAAVAYVPGARGTEPARFEELADAATATLVIVDDLDAAPINVAREVERLALGIGGRPAMLLVTHRQEAPLSLTRVAEQLAPPEQRRLLGPLEADDIKKIAALYAGGSAAELPIADLTAESGGLPAVVHQVASRWARESARNRLAVSADRTAAGRVGLRAAESDLIGDVEALETAKDRTRLYGVGSDGVGGEVMRTICPYKGLAEFEAADADYYFGRERLIAELVARFVGTTFLALVGDSGSGKSSALRAGLLPVLAGGVLPGSDGWRQVVMRPTERPMAELGRALARALPEGVAAGEGPSAQLDSAISGLAPGQRLVLVVDQFEETFTAARDDAERTAFIGLLTSARPGLKVVVSIRADHYGRCAAYPALARLVGADHVLVGPLTEAELRAVIEHPAERVGLRVEDALTEALVEDAGTDPGVLPLLSTALLELWQGRRDGRLSLAAYRASGGLRGAVARLAEAAYAELDPYRQTIARALFLRLAGPGEGSELVRRRVPITELDADRDPAVAEVLEILTAARLVQTGDGYVEVTHEALLREWPRLQGWLDEDADGRKVRLHLTGAVRDWDQRGRESGDLYRGARLATALEWASEHRVELNAAEQEYLDESRRLSEQEVARQRQTNRRLRALLAGAAVFLVLAVGTGAIAAFQARRAEAETQRASAEAQRAGEEAVRAEAEAQRAEAEAQRAEAEAVRAEDQRLLAEREADRARSRELTASAIAVLDEDPSLSKLLALEAGSASDDPPLALTTTLHQAFAADAIVGRYEWPANKEFESLWTDLDPSGQRLVASGDFYAPSNHLEVADIATGTVLWSHTVLWSDSDDQEVLIGPAFFSPDGTQVIAGFYWDQPEPPAEELGVFVWDADDGRLVRRYDTGPCGAIVTAVSSSRLLIRAPSPNPNGEEECIFEIDPGPAVEILDLESGEITTLAARAGLGHGSTMSGDGRFAAFDRFEDGAYFSEVIDLDTGETVLEIDQLANNAIQYEAYARRLNADGSLLLYGNRPIFVYDVQSGSAEPIAELGGQSGESFYAEFDAAGETVFETARDRALRQSDAREGTELAVWPAVGNGRPSISDDGGMVLVTDPLTSSAALVDTRPRGELGAVETCVGFGDGFVAATSLDAAGGYAAFTESCGGDDHNVETHIVHLATQTLLHSVPNIGTQTLRLSPDGTRFVSQALDWPLFGPAEVRDVRTGDLLASLEGLCSWDSDLAQGGAPRGEESGCKPYSEQPFAIYTQAMAWSPDGSMIAIVDGFDGYFAIWDAHEGRLLYTMPTDAEWYAQWVVFTPDSTGLLVASDHMIRQLSIETWRFTRETRVGDIQGANSLGLVGFTPDESELLVIGDMLGGGGGAIHWLDVETFAVTRSVEDAHEGSPKSAALSPAGSLLATGASDGVLRLWSTTDRSLLQEVKVGNEQVQGVAFVDDSHLAVTPQSGDLLIYATEPEELLGVVRDSLTRSFTQNECTTYGIDPCPALEELAAR